jgi:hypothetical protein
MTGTKKLQDFFTDEKLPRELRSLVPLAIHPRWGILWVAGMRIAARVEPQPGDAACLVLDLIPARSRPCPSPNSSDGAE